MFCGRDFPGNFLLRVRLTSGVWVSGWKAVLGLVSRSQEGAQRLSPVQLKGALQRCARLQGLKPEVSVSMGIRSSDRMEEGQVLFL